MSFLRNPIFLLGTNLSAIPGSTLYLRSHHAYNLEEHETRVDELEGTVCGHIGLTEEALDRQKGTAKELTRLKRCNATARPAGQQDVANLHRDEY